MYRAFLMSVSASSGIQSYRLSVSITFTHQVYLVFLRLSMDGGTARLSWLEYIG